MNENLEFRPLTKSDLPAAMRLKTIAGWNQTEDEWKRFIELDPKGTFTACLDGEVVATAFFVFFLSDSHIMKTRMPHTEKNTRAMWWANDAEGFRSEVFLRV